MARHPSTRGRHPAAVAPAGSSTDTRSAAAGTPRPGLWHREVVATRTVWVDDWQMQCCGEPFAEGSDVEWTVVPVTDTSWYAEILVPDVAASITDREDHHSERRDLVTVRGVVRSIDAVFCRYRVRARVAVPIAGSGVLVSRRSVDGWEDDSTSEPPRTFVGYVVALDTGR